MTYLNFLESLEWALDNAILANDTSCSDIARKIYIRETVKILTKILGREFIEDAYS